MYEYYLLKSKMRRVLLLVNLECIQFNIRRSLCCESDDTIIIKNLGRTQKNESIAMIINNIIVG